MTELISLGPWRYGSYSGTLKLSYEIISQNIQLNTTELKIKLTFPGNRQASVYGLTCTVDGQAWNPGVSKLTSSSSLEKIFAIKHNDDGTKSVSISLRADMSDDSGSDVKTASSSVALQQIPRGHRFALDQTMLSAGKSVTITAIKSIESYMSTITWDNGVNTGVVAMNSFADSWTVDYDTLSDGLAKGVTRNVTFTFKTYNGSDLITTTTSTLVITTGKITLSLYDDGTDTGVTFGERAVKPGVNFKNGTVIDFRDTTVLGLDNVVANVPVATTTVLGGVKSGGDILVDSNGTVTVTAISGKQIVSNTTAYWNAQTRLVPTKGSIYIYSDKDTLFDGKKVPGIKIGDGDAYLVDLPFVNDAIAQNLLDHINNTSVHVSAQDRINWNNKVSTEYSSGNRTLIFKTN